MSVSGITFGDQDPDFLIDTIALVEERDLESVWIGEAWGRNAVPLIARLLRETKRIDVCSGILNVYSRTPALLAMTANTLADLSGGRFRLGLGTSGPAVIEDFHGVPFEAPLRRTREYIEIVRGFLHGHEVEYEGEFFEVSGFTIDMSTHHDCPIYVAAIGETNRQLAGEFADGWMPLLVPSTGLSDALDAVERGAARGDRGLSDLNISPWVPCCISQTDPDAARDHVRSLVGFYFGAMGEYYARTAAEFGFGDAVDAVRDGWEREGLTGASAAVTDELVAAFGAAGTPAEAQQSFDRFAEAGADSLIAYVPSQFTSPEMTRKTLEHL
jgi:alkanesulfonate monooxygenase SsuD/methylene tetrahydromethanopterin reductase-like flavin-dependent oxidoreductase (luciferase family)